MRCGVGHTAPGVSDRRPLPQETDDVVVLAQAGE
jgi:hypothetical protein